MMIADRDRLFLRDMTMRASASLASSNAEAIAAAAAEDAANCRAHAMILAAQLREFQEVSEELAKRYCRRGRQTSRALGVARRYRAACRHAERRWIFWWIAFLAVLILVMVR